ncbi:hypothetical protein K9L67_06050 [Candidatus Woesearchaeota archaeon]|nr:hypothetical protein [Candidatus Woesearchaeota archaeon]MCF7901756.1 hypothetical protein [Candidatus Woesearchaeota archaeon]MCF8013175.1 hypothetical protein [Candidatus Woesearchaeota archaeon]
MNNKIEQGIQEFIKDLIKENKVPTIDSTEDRSFSPDTEVEFNSLRILALLEYSGVNGKIDSKLKFAFFDFLIRFPICLKYILDKNQESTNFEQSELTSIDKKMVRHISSAWDPDYYNYIAFLDSRNLVNTDFENKFSVEITSEGKEIIKNFESEILIKWKERCKLLKKIYGSKSDQILQKAINEHFAFTVI